MASTPVPGEGSVFIRLAGYEEELELKCSVDAALTLCRQPGGMESLEPSVSTVTSRLRSLDIDTMALIIRLGRGIGPSAVKDLPKVIYETGLYEVMLQLSPFLGALKNGGKRLDRVIEEDE